MKTVSDFFIIIGVFCLFLGVMGSLGGPAVIVSGPGSIAVGCVLRVLCQIRDALQDRKPHESTADVSAMAQAARSTMSVYCTACGNSNPELAVKCQHCGHRLAGTVE